MTAHEEEAGQEAREAEEVPEEVRVRRRCHAEVLHVCRAVDHTGTLHPWPVYAEVRAWATEALTRAARSARREE
jgi:hypothetical protein